MPRSRLFAALLAVLLLPMVSAAARETVTWLMPDIPPLHITEGIETDQGIQDRQRRFLQSILPQYDHKVITASVSRIWYQVAHEDGVCDIGALRTEEREKLALFSERPQRTPADRLVVLKDQASRLTSYLSADGAIDLQAMNGAGLRGGYATARRYSPVISDWMARPEQEKSLEGMPAMPQLFNLLKSGRVDFVFSSAVEASFNAARLHAAGQFALFPIKGEAAFDQTYIVCSKGPVGRAVLAAIDQSLAKEVNWAAYAQPWALAE